jgi:tRNA nucleotidyltransferase (CCA-adding enzyme)
MKTIKTASTPILNKIKLTETESSIREILLQVVDQLHQQFPLVPKINLRIAGGWVRDKLMGLQSNDIDIAIDTMTGEPFALAVKEYMDSKNHKISKVSKIQVNPEKSKHLETATVRVLGLDVDFVNLRSETYNADSRNPTVVS